MEMKHTKKKDVIIADDLVNRGIINNWDKFEQFLDFTFTKQFPLQDSQSFLVTETTFNPRLNREKLLEYMFEKMNASSFYFANQAELSLIASGRNTGIVVEAGGGVTNIVPIIEGQLIVDANIKMCLGGSDVTEYFKNSIDYQLCYHQYLKQYYCYVASNYEEELKKAESINECTRSIEFSCCKILINKERFMFSEILFNPKMV